MSDKPLDNTYNLFRIPKDKIQLLKNELLLKELSLTNSKTISGYTFSFYFSKKNPDSPVKWMELYKDFLPGESERFNRVYFAVLLIESKKVYSYAVSLGTAHFYVSKYADSDFGLDLAERIATQEIKEKYTKYFFNNKNQSVVKFRDDNDIDDAESGEYYQHIKSATISETDWGKYASFGASIILKLPLIPEKLVSLISKIETEIVKPIRVKIPRVQKIRDKNKIEALEILLKTALNSNANSSLFKSVVLSNKDFLTDETTDYFIYTSGNKGESIQLRDFDIESIKEFCKEQNINLGENLDALKVTIKTENSKPRSESLRHYIDFISDNLECILEGRWHKFNLSYLEHLDQLINKIKVEAHNITCDIERKEFDKYLKANPTSYVEKYYNELRANEGYINRDRFFLKLAKRYTIELLDLYKDKCIYFVKVGIPQKLSYVIDQAINTLNLFKNNLAKVEVDTEVVKLKSICLWIILDRKTKLSQLSDIDSLIFKWKLAEWVRLAKSLKIEPIVKINYRK